MIVDPIIPALDAAVCIGGVVRSLGGEDLRSVIVVDNGFTDSAIAGQDQTSDDGQDAGHRARSSRSRPESDRVETRISANHAPFLQPGGPGFPADCVGR